MAEKKKKSSSDKKSSIKKSSSSASVASAKSVVPPTTVPPVDNASIDFEAGVLFNKYVIYIFLNLIIIDFNLIFLLLSGLINLELEF
jgi:hypothetical protein